jgi:IS5 family transposase
MLHRVEVTGAPVHDRDVGGRLIRDEDEWVNGDAGYSGIENREELRKDEQLTKIDFRINKRNGAARKGEEDWVKHLEWTLPHSVDTVKRHALS